jgi:sugar phosphate isomerase/epimerase
MHDRVSVSSLCFAGSSLEEQEGFWRDLAPRRISLTSFQVFAEGEDRARSIVETGGYRVATLTHPFHLGPLTSDDKMIDAARKSLTRALNFAKTVGAESIYMVTGGRGGRSWEEAAELFAEAVAPCVKDAKTSGIPLLIETTPFVYANTHLTHTLRDTIKLAEMADIGVCIDLFAVWSEAGLRQLIECALPMCRLVQVADFVAGDAALPCRAVPGDGDIPVADIIGWLVHAGYDGGFDLELLGPRIDREGHVAATRRAGEYVGMVLGALGV